MKKTFTPLTSLLCLALAATAHPNNPQKIKRAAKQAMLRMPKHQRGMFAPVLASARPAEVIWGALEELTVKPRCQVAFDLETLGTSPDSKILSVGAVAVCAETGRTVRFYSPCSIDSQPGRATSPSTLKWWEGRTPEARTVLDAAKADNCATLQETLETLTAWLGKLGETHDVYAWGNGSDFDVAMLNHAYQQFSGFVPWNFRHARDMRTLYDITLRLGMDIKSSTLRTGTHHNALDDAQFQSNVIMESLRQIDLVAKFITGPAADAWIAFQAQQGGAE